MSGVVTRLAGEIRRRPLLALAVTGVAGAVMVSRMRRDGDRDEEPVPDGQRDADDGAGAGAGAGIVGSLAALARLGADVVDRGASLAERGAALVGVAPEPPDAPLPRARHEVSRVGAEVRDTLGETGERARRGVADTLDALSLPDLLQGLVNERLRPSRTERLRDAAASVGLTQKTLAVFAATLLARSASSYLSWRAEKMARSHAGPNRALVRGPDARRESAVPLEERTVIELRQMAAAHDIEGRSSMNKDELVAALADA